MMFGAMITDKYYYSVQISRPFSIQTVYNSYLSSEQLQSHCCRLSTVILLLNWA